MKKLLPVVFVVICASISNAQNVDSAVREASSKFMNSGHRVGFSVGVIENEQTYHYHFGSVKKDLVKLPDDQTIYEIGSVTKTFTSLLLAEAVVTNKVKLTDDIRKYLKGNYPNLQYQGKPIRLLHLANLTSGLPNNLPEIIPPIRTTNPDSQIFQIRDFHDNYSRTQFLNDLHLVKLMQPPGLNPSHSNTAGELLGFILENIYGESYETLLERYITRPLKMTNTSVVVPAGKQTNYSSGYNEKRMVMPEIPKDAAGAGVLKSSLDDMLIYLKDQLAGNDKKIVLSHQPIWGNQDSFAIGLNWSIKINFDGKLKIWTSGGTFGQSCYVCFYPERNFGVVILTNQSDSEVEDKLSEMAQNIYNDLYFPPAQRNAEGFGYSASINQLLDSLNKSGFNRAVGIAKLLKKSDVNFKLLEDEVNLWGYKYFFKGQKVKALEIFKLNISLYPDSPNAYDSLAETFEDLGDKASAIENYKQELKLNPANKDIADHLKKLQ